MENQREKGRKRVTRSERSVLGRRTRCAGPCPGPRATKLQGPLTAKPGRTWRRSQRNSPDNDNIGVQFGPGNQPRPSPRFRQSRRHERFRGCVAFGDAPLFRRASQPIEAPRHRLVVCKDAPDKRVFERSREGRHCSARPGEERDPRDLCRPGPNRRSAVTVEDDRIVWGTEEHEPPEMEWQEWSRRAGLLAFSTFGAACYPAEGSRDTFCMAPRRSAHPSSKCPQAKLKKCDAMWRARQELNLRPLA